MKTMLRLGTALALVAGTGTAAFAGPEVVAGPGADPECFAPWSADTKYLQWPAKEGPYRIAIVNGFVGNTWRIQMIKTAKAYAEDPAVKDKIAELKVVSTGTDAPAQLGAIEDFINQGFDAIVTIAVSPDGFDRVIRLADKNDVVIVPFDNVLDTDAVMQVNEDQLEMGRKWAQFLVDELKAAGKTGGKILEVRGLPGNSVDRDRSIGIHEVLDGTGGEWEVVQVVGNWDDGTAQKVTADAIAVHGQFDAVTVQGGSTGTVQAMMDAGHPFVPVAGESRERLPQADRRAFRRGPEGHLDRPVARPRRRLDEGGDLGARGQPDAAADLGAAADRRPTQDAEGRRELLVGPARQLLHRQRVPALRRQRLRPRHHGADRGRHVRTPAPAEPIVTLTGISKHFQGVRALEAVDFACHAGSIHAVLGENGAGKSTLIKIIAGVLRPDSASCA